MLLVTVHDQCMSRLRGLVPGFSNGSWIITVIAVVPPGVPTSTVRTTQRIQIEQLPAQCDAIIAPQ